MNNHVLTKGNKHFVKMKKLPNPCLEKNLKNMRFYRVFNCAPYYYISGGRSTTLLSAKMNASPVKIIVRISI